MKSLDSIVEIPEYHFCFIKPKTKSDNSRVFLAASKIEESTYVMFLVNYVLFFYTDKISIAATLGYYSNNQNDKVIVALGENDH